MAPSGHSGVAVQLLRKRHSSPRTSRWRQLPGQSTARASGHGQRYGSRSTTASELAANAPKRTLWMTTRSRTAPSGTSSSVIVTSICFPGFGGPWRWHSRGAWSLDAPRPGLRASKEPRAVTSPVRIGVNQQSDLQSPGSAKLRAAAQNNREDAAADRRTTWEASMCLDSPRASSAKP